MASPESNRIEYKEILSRQLDLEKEVVAFLNYSEGGLIYIGIDTFGNASGVEDIDGDMLKIKDRIKSNISPSAMGLFDVIAEERNKKPIIKIIVASGSKKPYFKTKYGMSSKGCFRFPQNFVRSTFPAAEPVRNEPTPQVKRLLGYLTEEKSREELQELPGITDRKYFRRNDLQPALSEALIERSIPDKPQRPKQTYRLTARGRVLAGHD